MPSPRRSLLCLERFSLAGATLADWQREAGSGFNVIQPLLRDTSRLARRWSRPGRPAMRIVEHADGRAVAVCDEDIDGPIELSHADRMLRRPCEKRLRTHLCRVLGLHETREPVASLPGVVLIGDWRPEPAVSVQASIAVASSCDDLGRLILDVRLKAHRPVILATFTRQHWSSRHESALADGRVVLVPLEDVLDERDSAWHRLPSWEPFARQAIPRTSSPSPPIDLAELRAQVQRLKPMEREAIVALAEKGLAGPNSGRLPGQALLAKWAGNYDADATFKAAMSNLVKMGLFDNARHHGTRGGYFLTPRGLEASKLIDQS
ncbi:MAG: hypothetical protein IT439_07165 [Phycisphaerales bacterium]|nr:hypothetical protein [Phycisphaerales bacterium]